MFYSVLDPRNGDQSHQVDLGPYLQVHHVLEMAVQSFDSKACCGCKAAGPDLALPSAAASTTSEAGDVTKKSLSRCAKCQIAYCCDHDCQNSVWSSHKLACSNLRAGSLLCTSPASASASDDTSQCLKVQAQHKERTSRVRRRLWAGQQYLDTLRIISAPRIQNGNMMQAPAGTSTGTATLTVLRQRVRV